MCTACGPFGPWVQAGSRPDFPGSLKGRPLHRSLRACRRHEHSRQLPPHGRADPAPCSFPPAVLRREVLLYQRNIESSARTERLWARRSGSRWPSFSMRLWGLARRSRSRVRRTSTPTGQPSHGMRTVAQPGRGTPQQCTTTAPAVRITAHRHPAGPRARPGRRDRAPVRRRRLRGRRQDRGPRPPGPRPGTAARLRQRLPARPHRRLPHRRY
jgi:hypothetical protein